MPDHFKTCPDCGAHRIWKGQHPIAYRAAFRKFHLPGPPLTVGLDGGYPVRNLQHCLGPESEHLLD
jgi:hypothetical protein